MRAETPEDKTHWIDVLQSYKVPVGVDMTSLMRYGSTISLQSNSTTFNQSSNIGGLREKVNEIETFKDIILNQITTLQRYFDVCANASQKGNSFIDLPSDLKTVDLKVSLFFFFGSNFTKAKNQRIIDCSMFRVNRSRFVQHHKVF